MFETENVPCYIERMGHKNIKIGKDKFKGTELVLRVDPFSAELAAELEDVKSRLYRRNDAEADPHIDSVSFTFRPKPQLIEIRPAEDVVKASVKILEAKVGKFRARKPSDGTQWVLKFNVTFAEVSGNDLLYLKEALFEQRFFTFADAQGGLFEEAEKEERRESKDAKPVKRGRRSSEPTGESEPQQPTAH